MSAAELVAVSLDRLPGWSLLQSLGAHILTVAFFVWVAIELFRLVTRGACDLVTPIVRVGVAFALLSSLPALGASVGLYAEGVANALFEASELSLLSSAHTHLAEEFAGQGSWGITGLFTLKGMVTSLSMGLFVLMAIVKVVMLDLLWPVVLSLVIFLGVLSIPLSVLPGMGGFSAWFESLIEVVLWPVVFQGLLALMVTAFSETLHSASTLELSTLFAEASAATAEAGSDPALRATDRALGSGLSVLPSFWAMGFAYCLLALLTPWLASKVIRSAPATGMVTFLSSRIVSLTRSVRGRVAATGVGARLASGPGASTAAWASAHRGGGASTAGHAPSVTSRVAAPTSHASVGAVPSNKTTISPLDRRGYPQTSSESSPATSRARDLAPETAVVARTTRRPRRNRPAMEESP